MGALTCVLSLVKSMSNFYTHSKRERSVKEKRKNREREGEEEGKGRGKGQRTPARMHD